jgi:alpha-galactosidase
MVELYLENVPGDTLASFTSMLRSATLGWATIMIDTTKWTTEQKEIAKREFALYKEKLRPLIAGANLYHILPRPNGKRWDGIQYHDPATDTGVVYAFRAHAEEETQTIKLRGLNPTLRYTVDCVDSSLTKEIRTGQELMKNGLSVRIADEDGSDLVFLSPLSKQQEL